MGALGAVQRHPAVAGAARDPRLVAPGSRASSRAEARTCWLWARTSRQMRILNPAAVPWRQEVVPALGALDRTAEARRLVDEGERQGRRVRRAARDRRDAARPSRDRTPRRAAIETLHESVAVLERTVRPMSSPAHVWSWAPCSARRTAPRVARAASPGAGDRASVGADGIEGRAREELAAAGSRPRNVVRTGVDELTASELRTAKLAADGLGNVQIAQRLFVTRKTVEKHLSNAYMKLEIGSRGELSAALGTPLSARTDGH